MTHYEEQRWVATPNAGITALVLEFRDDLAFQYRFFSKVDLGFDVDDCHIWTGALSTEGYGDFSIRHRTIRAHRVSYILQFGEPPAAAPFLDHVDCIGRFCVNARHLEPVNNAENTKRGRGIGRSNQRSWRSEVLLERAERRAAGEDEIF